MWRQRDSLGRFGLVVITLAGLVLGTVLPGCGPVLAETVDERTEAVRPVGLAVGVGGATRYAAPESRGDEPRNAALLLTTRDPNQVSATRASESPRLLFVGASSGHARGPPPSLPG